ncbi:MAG: hypothetical protein JSV92_03710 [archaeon]|nr:MAG: hypothetical protein JSV92_03710 [archaeon]
MKKKYYEDLVGLINEIRSELPGNIKIEIDRKMEEIVLDIKNKTLKEAGLKVAEQDSEKVYVAPLNEKDFLENLYNGKVPRFRVEDIPAKSIWLEDEENSSEAYARICLGERNIQIFGSWYSENKTINKLAKKYGFRIC